MFQQLTTEGGEESNHRLVLVAFHSP